MKTPEHMDLDLKSKRIVYQMSQELEQTDLNDDFHAVLLSLEMPKMDKKAGFDGFLKLQNEIKESLKDYKDFGVKSDILKLLSNKELKCVNQMLKSKRSSSERDSGQGSSKDKQNGEYSGERIVAKKIQAVVEDVEVEVIPHLPVPFGIPRLQVGQLYEDIDESDELEWISSQPGRSSSGIPEVPMEPAPKQISHRSSQRQHEPQKNVTFVVEATSKKIMSRARLIEKTDAQIQTDAVEEEVEDDKMIEEKVQTADIGTNCRMLITPRVEEVEEPISRKSSPILSPISTVPSDLSEGEVINPMKKVIVVRTDGSIVPTPRAIEDEEDDIVGYDGDYDVASDILIAKSSSSFGVAEVDMSISSAHSH